MENEKIGIDAVKIWQILNEKGNIKIADLKKSTKMDIKNIFLALGWLARENKVLLFEMEKELAARVIS